MKLRNNKSGKIFNLLLSVIALFVIIFIIVFIVNKGKSNKNYDAIFTSNLNLMHENAKTYFADELPEKIGDSKKISLGSFVEMGNAEYYTYKDEKCNIDDSFSQITKISNNEYQIKTNLVCGSKTDNIIEKISLNTVINDEDGNTIIDDEKDDVIIEVNKEEENSSKSNVSCKNGSVSCRITQLETTCTSTYTYEYVKKSVSCPNGYTYENGTCVKYNEKTLDPGKTNKVETAKVNTGKEYKVYTEPTITQTDGYYSCSKGTLAGKNCYEYTNLITTSTSSCPSGYTEEGGVCYKYDTVKTSTSSSCPSGYTEDGGACYKYDTVKTSTSSSCPSGYTEDGGACYKYDTVKTSTSSSCPAGYTKENGACYKYTNLTTNTNTSYSCPSGYTKTSDGSKCYKTSNATYTEGTKNIKCEKGYTLTSDKTKCYKTVKSDDTYYCENANATLKDKLCYYTVANKTCLAGYIYNENDKLCHTKESQTTSPIYSNSETIYSSKTALDGYQRTGKAKFKMVCESAVTK